MRRESDNCSQLQTNLLDILSAFEVLDSFESLPTICCVAFTLHRIPPLSLDPVAEQVNSNTGAIILLASVIPDLEKKVSNLIDVCKLPVLTTNGNDVSYASALNSKSKLTPPS